MMIPAPTSDSGMVTIGITTARRLPRNRKITDDDDDDGRAERGFDLVDRGLDEFSRVVGDLHLEPRAAGCA